MVTSSRDTIEKTTMEKTSEEIFNHVRDWAKDTIANKTGVLETYNRLALIDDEFFEGRNSFFKEVYMIQIMGIRFLVVDARHGGRNTRKEEGKDDEKGEETNGRRWRRFFKRRRPPYQSE